MASRLPDSIMLHQGGERNGRKNGRKCRDVARYLSIPEDICGSVGRDVATNVSTRAVTSYPWLCLVLR